MDLTGAPQRAGNGVPARHYSTKVPGLPRAALAAPGVECRRARKAPIRGASEVMTHARHRSTACCVRAVAHSGARGRPRCDGQTTLRINIAIAQNSHYGVAIDTFAREVETRTGGRYKVQTFYSGALGAERESVEGVQLGTLDLTLTSTGPLPNFVPEVAILDIPFLFRDYAHARAVLDGPIGQELLAKFPPKGMIGLAWAENGFRHMTNSKRPVNLPEDLKGLKMRTMENPIHIEAYRQFGILPTPMAFTEVFTALQQGTVDGQENPLSVITAAKLDQVQKYLSLTGHVYSPAVFLMNKAQWDKLSDADKQAFLDAAKEGVKANRARVDEDERQCGRRSSRQGHDRCRECRQGEVPGRARPVYADFGKRFGQANIDRIRNYR